MSSEKSPLRALGAALLNATLMLAALVLLLAVLLVWQVRGLAQDLREGMAAQIATNVQPRIEEALTRLESQPAAPAVQDAQASLRAVLDELGRVDPADPVATEGVMRQLVIAVFASVVQRMLDDTRQ